MGVHEASTDGVEDGLGAIMDFQLLVDVARVVTDGPLRDVEGFGYLLVALALRHGPYDLYFPPGQLGNRLLLLDAIEPEGGERPLRYAEVIREQAGTANPARYARGPGGQIASSRTGTNTPTYYHRDSVGSVVALSSNSGTLTDSYSYEAFGSVRARTGTSK